MTVRLPSTDARRAAVLRAELDRAGSAMVPGWGVAAAPGSFGRALLEIAARFAEETSSRLDRTAERDALAFYDTLDVPPPAPQAATATLVFVTEEARTTTTSAPLRVQVGATVEDQEVIFETTRALEVSPARIAEVVAVDPDTDHIERAPGRVVATERPPDPVGGRSPGDGRLGREHDRADRSGDRARAGRPAPDPGHGLPDRVGEPGPGHPRRPTGGGGSRRDAVPEDRSPRGVHAARSPAARLLRRPHVAAQPRASRPHRARAHPVGVGGPVGGPRSAVLALGDEGRRGRAGVAGPRARRRIGHHAHRAQAMGGIGRRGRGRRAEEPVAPDRAPAADHDRRRRSPRRIRCA